MPPKKARGTEDDSMASNSSVEDYLLPRTMVQRLAKGVLPANTSIQKDALSAILKSTTVFVNYIANNANERAILGNHKTIKPEDVLDALKDMEFEHFIPRVQQEHDKFVAIQNEKRTDYRKRSKTDNKEKDANAGDQQAPAQERADPGGIQFVPQPHFGMDGPSRTEDEPPAAKRPRMSLPEGQEMGAELEDRDATEDDADATELEEPEDEEDVDDEEEEDFADAEETQPPVEEDLEGGIEMDDSNQYQRRDADEESDDGY